MNWHIITLNWLIHASLSSFLLLLIGAAAVRWCRQPIQRIRLIELTLLGALLVPWVGQLPGLPRWSVGWLTLETPPPSQPVVPEAPGVKGPTGSPGFGTGLLLTNPDPDTQTPVVSLPVAAVDAVPEPPVAAALMTAPPAPLPAESLAWLVVVAYGCGVAGLVLHSLVGLAYLAWLRRKAYPVPAEVADLFSDIAGEAGRRVRLLASDDIAMPLAFAGWRPTILLPGSMCRSWDTAALRYSLAHEWSHIEGGDVWRWYLATLVQLLFFYQPLFWWLRWQLRLSQDYLADARAAEQAEEREDYAAFLVTLARRRLGVPAAALGISDRRSNLYRRITMLLQTHQPLQRRCLTLWTVAVTLIAVALFAASSAVRLDAGAPADEKKSETKEPPKEQAKDKPAEKGETLNYTGKVTDKDTKKPIAGAIVTVRRSLYGDPEIKESDRLMEESKHQTNDEGKYSFVIPPEQSSKRYTYIELDVEHPEYAPKKGFGYALSMIRKNEKLGGRPFFEHVELRPGKPITGQILTPEGKPVKGVKVLAYSNTDQRGQEFEYGSFADMRTDADGKFRLVLITPGPAVFWILPEEYALSTHGVKDNKRGDLGMFTLSPGIRFSGKVLDAKGKPLAGVNVNAEGRGRGEELQGLQVADHINRSATTNEQGEFAMAPLPPGQYSVKPDENERDGSKDRKDRTPRPVPAVFVAQRVTLKEGPQMDPIEVRAVPHVTILAQYINSKGEKTRGHGCFIFGQMDRESWFGQGKSDVNGTIEIHIPHGLQNVRLDLSTNEHGVLRWRKTKDGPLSATRQIDLATVNDDVKGIEIIRYTAPILVINAVDATGQQVKGFKAQVTYEPGKSPKQPGARFVNGVEGDVYLEKQEDGRWRTSQMLPEEEVTITASADGYESKSQKLKLPEGETRDVQLVLEKK